MSTKSFDVLEDVNKPAQLYNLPELPDHLWPDAIELYELWHSKKNNRAACSRQDLTPRDMIKQLPLISLHDIERDPFRLKVRLMGTQFAAAIGMDATDKYVDELDKTQDVIHRAQWVAENCEPILCIGLELVWSPFDYKKYDSLVLPLINDEQSVDMILYLNRFY
ncbi:PAS domain-containing protein [Kordiimonas sp. SCSIO 12610]|uniref:PAS domain-containing protein n=1 Tax=Kordiimonas sp. SCSIO 12610 TaxID=2829597 RepID=UPI00210E6805|nr:PAS domain-containing protein [Kordiimonas sp. SCSIO 12610]UTW56786.1 PAS domain-containing protein [Kordiimonas sp. SCSIO 12610]